MPFTVTFDSGHKVTFENKPTPDEIDEVSKRFAAPKPAEDSPYGLMEAINPESTIHALTGVAGAGAGMVARLGAGLMGKDARAAGDAVSEAMTYQPRTESGKKSSAIIDRFMQKVSEEGMNQANQTYKMLPGNADKTLDPILQEAGNEVAQMFAPAHIFAKGAKLPKLKEPMPTPKVEPIITPPEFVGPRQIEGPPVNDPMAALYAAHPELKTMPEPLPEAPMADPGLPHITEGADLPIERSPQTQIQKAGAAGPELAPLADSSLLKETTPFPRIPEPTRDLLALQDPRAADVGVRNVDQSRFPTIEGQFENKPAQVQGMHESFPTIDFPLRMEAFDKDTWLNHAKETVQQLHDNPTADSAQRISAIQDHAIEYAKERFGIDADTVRNKLYESGGETALPIKKGGRSLSINGKNQAGFIDFSGIIPQSLIDRFKKKDATSGGDTPLAKSAAEVFGNLPGKVKEGLRGYMPVNDPLQVIEAAVKGERDIKPTSDAARSFGSGLGNKARNTGNTLLRYGEQVLTNAREQSKAAINKYINDKDTGIASYLNKMKHSEVVKTVELWKKEDAQNRRFTDDEMRQQGYSEKQIQLQHAVRAANDHQWSLNSKGQRLEGYIPHSFQGDYIRLVFDKEGNVKAVLNAAHTREMAKAETWAKEKYGNDVSMSPLIRKGIRSEKSMYDRGILNIDNIMDILSKPENLENGNISGKAVLNMIEQRNAASTRNLFNADVHQKSRSTHDVEGWDGNKPWLDESTNARQMVKSYINTFEQQMFHHHLQEPVNNLKKLYHNDSVIKQMPNAVEEMKAHMNAATGQTDLWATGHMANTGIDAFTKLFGYGGSAPAAVSSGIRGVVHGWQLGINLKNFVVQHFQPITSGVPNAIAAGHLSGLSRAELTTSAIKGVATWMGDRQGVKATGFTKDMFDYMNDNGIRSFAEADRALDAARHPIIRKLDTASNYLSSQAEKNTRPPVFSMMAHILDDAWTKEPTLFKDKTELFDTARGFTNSAMINYSEAPTGYRKTLGTTGPLAGQFKTYAHGTIGNMRNLYAHDKVAAASMAGMIVALAGLEGMPFYQDADHLVQWVTGHMGNRFNSIRDLVRQNLPTAMKLSPEFESALFDGKLSQSTGMDIKQPFGFSQMIPAPDLTSTKSVASQMGDAIPAMSLGGAVAKGIGAAIDPTNVVKRQDAIKSLLPSQLRKPYENAELTRPNGGVMNPAKNDQIEYFRNPQERTMANFGMQSLKETQERENNYKAGQQAHKTSESQKQAIGSIIGKIQSNSLNQGDIERAFKDYGKTTPTGTGDPVTFVQAIVNGSKQAQLDGKMRGGGITPNTINAINKWIEYNQRGNQQK